MKKNLNTLAVSISKEEGLKKQIDIAQIKEVLRALIGICKDDCGFLLVVIQAALKK